MPLLLFHGTEILGFMAGIGLGLVGWVFMLNLLLNRPPRQPLILVVGYLVLAIGAYYFFWTIEQNPGRASDPGLFLVIPWAFCFPWSFLLFVVLVTGTLPEALLQYASYVLPVGIALNAILIFITAKVGHRRVERNRVLNNEPDYTKAS